MRRINQCVETDRMGAAGAGRRVTLTVALTDDIWAAMGKTRGLSDPGRGKSHDKVLRQEELGISEGQIEDMAEQAKGQRRFLCGGVVAGSIHPEPGALNIRENPQRIWLET